MIPTLKTDTFLNQLGYIGYYLNLYIFDTEVSDCDIFDDWAEKPSAFLNIYESYLILSKHFGNDTDNYIKLNDEDIDVIILLDYFDNPDYFEFINDSSNDTINAIKNGDYIVKDELLKKIIEEKKKIYRKVDEMDHINLNDISNEFWALCVDVDHIRQYVRVFDVKFQKKLPLLSIVESLNFKKLNEIKFENSTRVIFEDGSSKDLSIFLDESKINYPPLIEKEYKHYLEKTIEELTKLVFQIKDMFDSFTLMTEEAPEIDVIKPENRIILKNKQAKNIEILYRNLVESKFISQDSDLESFKSIFHGYSTSNFIPIKWLNNKQLLRELLTELKHNDTKIAEMQRLIPTLFIDKQSNPLILAKNKHLDTRESRQIQKFLRLCE